MKFILAIPAYNEIEIIEKSLDKIFFELKQNDVFDWQVFVMDNGSTDGTYEFLKRNENDQKYLGKLKAFKISEKGKGIAIINGAKEAEKIEADFFGFIDADLSIHPKYISEFIKILVNQNDLDIAVGSRLLNETLVNRSKLRTLSSKFFAMITHSILDIDIVDTQCGLKIFNKKSMNIVSNCNEKGWFLDLEILAKSKKNDLIVKEIPVEWNENVYENRKSKLKIFRDGLSGLRAVMRIRNNL